MTDADAELQLWVALCSATVLNAIDVAQLERRVDGKLKPGPEEVVKIVEEAIDRFASLLDEDHPFRAFLVEQFRPRLVARVREGGGINATAIRQIGFRPPRQL